MYQTIAKQLTRFFGTAKQVPGSEDYVYMPTATVDYATGVRMLQERGLLISAEQIVNRGDSVREKVAGDLSQHGIALEQYSFNNEGFDKYRERADYAPVTRSTTHTVAMKSASSTFSLLGCSTYDLLTLS